MVIINQEKQKHNKTGKMIDYFVARDENNKILGKRHVKNSNLTLQEVKNIYKQNNTLFENVYQSKVKLTNLTEHSVLTDTTIGKRFDDVPKSLKNKPKAIYVQYVVEGYYKGKYVVARSQKIGGKTSFKAENVPMARKEAWISFIERATADKDGYYNDNAENIFDPDKLTNVKEGYIYYTENTH